MAYCRSLVLLLFFVPFCAAEETIDDKIAQMSLKSKVGQLFMGFVHGECCDEEMARFLSSSHLGNLIYFRWSNGLTSKGQIARLSTQVSQVIENTTGIPPLIAVDQEGGVVNRLQEGFTQFPSALSVGATQDASLARAMGQAIGKELRSVGIHWNLAPVADINSNPSNPVIGIRAFGSTPNVVTENCTAFIQGLHRAGRLSCLKHFPGHGDTSADSHYALPTVHKTKSAWEKEDAVPFVALHKKTDAIITAHVHIPSLDPNAPATFSYPILTEILREEIGYEGVILSDSLSMQGAIGAPQTYEQAAQAVCQAAADAFQAGCDCMIIGRLEWAPFSTTPKQDSQLIERTINNFAERVERGEISEKRVNNSLRRLLTLKQKSASFSPQPLNETAHEQLAKTIATRALTLLSSEPRAINLKEETVLLLAPACLEKSLTTALSKRKEWQKNTLLFFTEDSTPADLIQKASSYDTTLLFSYNATHSPKQKALITTMSETLPPNTLILIGMRNPQDLATPALYERHTTYLTYSPVPASFLSIFDELVKTH